MKQSWMKIKKVIPHRLAKAERLSGRYVLRAVRVSITFWFLYMAVCLVIPPLYHKLPIEKDNLNDDGSAMTGQERIRSIDNNVDALLWRLRLIESAKERIVLVTFDFRDDNSGRDIMASLLAAAERDVKVQILVDGINGTFYLKNNRNFQELTAHQNVEAKFYNPITLMKPWKNNYRMHDKYLIADNFAYILGGRNTDDLFLGDYVDSYNEDRDILVYETIPGGGKSYYQLQKYFEKIWALPDCKTCDTKKKAGDGLKRHYQDLCEKYPGILYETDWEKETKAAESIFLYTNPIETENKHPLLWDRMLTEMKGADNILIQTPYIICSREMYQDLTELCSEGRTDLIINAVEGGTNPFGCTDYLNQKKNLRRTGISIYEYLGPQALHTKTVLVGDTLSIVGSCNMDMRSVYLNTEMMLFIESRELNESLRNQTEVLKQSSRQTRPDGTVIAGEKYEQFDQGIEKKILYGIIRILILPFRHLL